MNFEQGIKELEQMISSLESGELKFDDALKTYEDGANLCKSLLSELNTAKGKITVIRNDLSGFVEEDMQ